MLINTSLRCELALCLTPCADAEFRRCNDSMTTWAPLSAPASMQDARKLQGYFGRPAQQEQMDGMTYRYYGLSPWFSPMSKPTIIRLVTERFALKDYELLILTEDLEILRRRGMLLHHKPRLLPWFLRNFAQNVWH